MSGIYIVLESGHPTHPKKKLTRKKLSSQNLKILIRVWGSLPTSSFQFNFFQTPKKKGGGWREGNTMINVISFFWSVNFNEKNDTLRYVLFFNLIKKDM